ncbi:MAG: ribbon-helix-helix protein, CopG family [Trueperaceae bacterium]|nr:ribbon-helix-helix protein, CopG family [Trueperaceae bacterium]
MLTVRLDPDLEAQLNELSETTGRSKSHYVRQALQEFLEDREDYLLAIAALERNEPTVGLEELRRELGL